MKNLTIIGLTPFERPDVNLMPKMHQAGIFPVLSLGHELSTAEEALRLLDQLDIPSYGIYISNEIFLALQFPEKVTFAILPSGMSINQNSNLNFICQVTSLEEARQAEQAGAKGIIIKGNEAGG
jgi:NAD(P)H-dependent flavin oxidoreductase YrpB (nitropropane dioxygenase family)